MSNRTLYGELPESTLPERGGPGAGTFLYCPHCGNRYSATRGDYWNADPNATIVCRGSVGARHRAVCMFIAREVCTVVKVRSHDYDANTLTGRPA
jgi:hypothetical protein